ncbi:MAG: hypothetical protein V7641_1754 [Blastocatellia bacterium]
MRIIARVAVLAAVFLVPLALPAAAQPPAADQANPITRGTDVYCTGYISDVMPSTDLQIIGAEQENMKVTYAQGDVVFLNRGRGAGIQPGAAYFIIRPLGEFKHPFTKKKMGVYVREVGLLRVLEVQEQTATAQILVSCDTVEFGDLLKPYEEIAPPVARDARPLPRYSEGSKETPGQIIMSPGFHEHLSANRVVFVDLGRQQNVQPGDYFTIYRQTGPGEGITKSPKGDVVQRRDKDFGSDRYQGGEYAIQATSKSLDKIMKERPPIPRKVLGELIVLKVENHTCVAMITRTTAEVTIGDFVERSN